jgi:predicted ferric reductase
MTENVHTDRAHRAGAGQAPAAPPAGPGFRGTAWVLVGLPLLPVLLWRMIPDIAGMTSTTATLRLLALHAGLLGYVCFALALVLGARFAFVERAFVSLDRMYRFHRRLAAAVAALLVTHVVLMLVSVAASGTPVTTVLRPDPGWRVFAGVVAVVAFACVISVTTFARLRHEPFLRVHRLFGVVFAAGALHALRVPAFVAQSRWLSAYLGLVTVAAAVAWVYRSGLGRTLVRRHFYEVAAIRRVRPDVTEVTLVPLEQPLLFEPGQLVFIGVDDDAVTREQHPFSITSAPGDRELRMVVKAVGDFTGGLPDVRPGSMVRVEGPYGGFWRGGRAYRRQVWIAGGIGVTPFLSIARSLDDDAYDIDFFYCTEDVQSAVFLDELYAIADHHPRLRVISVRVDSLGFLTADDVRAVCGDLSRIDIFMCGPPAMIDALTTQFTAQGVSRDRLHYEDFRLRPRQA